MLLTNLPDATARTSCGKTGSLSVDSGPMLDFSLMWPDEPLDNQRFFPFDIGARPLRFVRDPQPYSTRYEKFSFLARLSCR
jgi:hypothetical protein